MLEPSFHNEFDTKDVFLRYDISYEKWSETFPNFWAFVLWPILWARKKSSKTPALDCQQTSKKFNG